MVDMEINTPKSVKIWEEKIQEKARHNGLVSLSILISHHIMPNSEIQSYLETAFDYTSSGIIIKVLKYAVDKGIIQDTVGILDNIIKKEDKLIKDMFNELASYIVYAHGNLIPGPGTNRRIDDPKSNWEDKGALTDAFSYVKALNDYLKIISENFRYDGWVDVINHANNKGLESIKAQRDIENYADAWATHPVYKIYTRLTEEETLFARVHYDAFGLEAWINPRHRKMNSIAGVFEMYEPLPPDEISRKAIYDATQGIFKESYGDSYEITAKDWFTHHIQI